VSDFREAYFQAVSLAESRPAPASTIRWECSSLQALERATRGTFPVTALESLPVNTIRKYFRQVEPGVFEAAPELRARIEFTIAAKE